MASEDEIKLYPIPPSYDVGAPAEFAGLLSGDNRYIQAYIAEAIGQIDDNISKNYDYATGKITNATPSHGFHALDTIASGISDAMLRASVPAELVRQINKHIDYMTKSDGMINFLYVKKFMAFMGIDGVYDLENKRHFRVFPKLGKAPNGVTPNYWGTGQDYESNRLRLGLLMSTPQEHEFYKSFDARIKAIRVEGSRITQAYAKMIEEERPDELVPHKTAGVLMHNPENLLVEHPEIQVLLDNRDKLFAEKADFEQVLRVKYAPEDPKYYPVINPRGGPALESEIAEIMQNQRVLKKSHADFMESLGIKPDSPDFVKYDHNQLRIRANAIENYVLRDYTTNPNQKGVLANTSLTHAYFVDAMKDELKLISEGGGLTSICKTPHRIEAHPDGSGRYVLFTHDLPREIFDVSQLERINEVGAWERQRYQRYLDTVKPTTEGVKIMTSDNKNVNDTQEPEAEQAAKSDVGAPSEAIVSGDMNDGHPDFQDSTSIDPAFDSVPLDAYAGDFERMEAEGAEPAPEEPNFDLDNLPPDEHEANSVEAESLSLGASEPKIPGMTPEESAKKTVMDEAAKALRHKNDKAVDKARADQEAKAEEMMAGGSKSSGQSFSQMPPAMTFNIGLPGKGLATAFGAGLGKAYKGVTSRLSPGANGPQQSADPEGCFSASLEVETAKIANARQAIEASRAPGGTPMSPEALNDNWGKINTSMDVVEDNLKAVIEMGKPADGSTLSKAIEDAKAEVEAVGDAADKEPGDSPAKEQSDRAKKAAESLLAVLKVLLEALQKLFGRRGNEADSENAPNAPSP